MNLGNRELFCVCVLESANALEEKRYRRMRVRERERERVREMIKLVWAQAFGFSKAWNKCPKKIKWREASNFSTFLLFIRFQKSLQTSPPIQWWILNLIVETNLEKNEVQSTVISFLQFNHGVWSSWLKWKKWKCECASRNIKLII